MITLTKEQARSAFPALRTRARGLPLVQVACLIALWWYAYTTIPGISTRPSIYALLILAGFLGLAAVGQTLVVLMGGIDMSIPGLILVGAVMTCMLGGGRGWSLAVVVVATLLAGAAIGAVSGALSLNGRAQPLIVTLAVGTIATGFMLVWLDGNQPPPAPAELATWSAPISTTFGLPIPPLVLLWLVIAVVVTIALQRTVVGRRVYLAGANPRAAGLTLVPTSLLWVAAFAVSGACAAGVGVLLAGFAGTADQNIGQPYLFQSLTAVIVGGTAFGARGGYMRTVLGAITLVLLSTILLGKGYTFADQQIVYGLLILLAVGAYGRDRRLADRI
jgi:ribose transport system permease protein